METIKSSVHIIGDWKNPPKDLAALIQGAGHHIVNEWWNDIDAQELDAQELVLSEVKQCDVLVFDMRGPRFGTHYYAGSHLTVGMAIAMGKQLVVLSNQDVPINAHLHNRLYTSLLNSNLVETPEEVIEFIGKEPN